MPRVEGGHRERFFKPGRGTHRCNPSLSQSRAPSGPSQAASFPHEDLAKQPWEGRERDPHQRLRGSQASGPSSDVHVPPCTACHGDARRRAVSPPN